VVLVKTHAMPLGQFLEKWSLVRFLVFPFIRTISEKNPRGTLYIFKIFNITHLLSRKCIKTPAPVSVKNDFFFKIWAKRTIWENFVKGVGVDVSASSIILLDTPIL
jgi:hypothetical protein